MMSVGLAQPMAHVWRSEVSLEGLFSSSTFMRLQGLNAGCQVAQRTYYPLGCLIGEGGVVVCFGLFSKHILKSQQLKDSRFK